MQIVKVIGTVVSSKKLEDLKGVKLLVVQPVDLNLQECGKPFLAVDSIGAGYGEIVCYAKSRSGAMTLENPNVCVDAGITGIIDSIYCP